MEQELYLYIASFDDVLENFKGNLLDIQKEYVFSDRKITFNPIIFYCNNVSEILVHSIKKNDNNYYKYKTKSFKILNKGKLTKECINNIINLYIESRLDGYKWNNDTFDSKSYYSQYYYIIDEYFYKNKDIEFKVEKFYIEYGYLNKLYLKPIDGLIYIASVCNFTLSEKDAVKIYFNSDDKPILNFNPYVYIASNYETLNSFVGSDNCVYEKKATMHYITTNKKYSSDNFNHYEWLANNHDKIKELMTNTKGVYNYDITKINKVNTSKLFIKYKGEDKKQFDHDTFVKMYLTDPEINYDKKLSIQNASKYFVQGYITNSTVRWRTTFRYKILHFIRNRIFDGLRQTPIHIGKHIICKSCVSL